MKKTSLSVIIVMILVITPSLYVSGAKIGGNRDSGNHKQPSIADLIRSLDIEFAPPKTILDCGSLFELDVTISKKRFPNIPRFFSVSVFLEPKKEDEYNTINCIGCEPFVFLPYNKQSKTISVSCLTNKNLNNNLYRLNSGEKNKFELYDGSIGVRIDRLPGRSFIDWISTGAINVLYKDINLWQAAIYFNWINNLKESSSISRQDEENIVDMTIEDYKGNNIFLQRKNIVRILSRLALIRSRLINLNPFVEWRDVQLLPPFLCSTDIYLDDVQIDNETNEYGNFTVNFTIVNDLDETVMVRGDVDISDTPMINSLIPMFKNKFYSAGFFRKEIEAHGRVPFEVKCRFPEEDSFYNKTYDVKIEFAPYIPIGETNQFGFLFFNLRWQMLLQPKYSVNGTVKNSIKTMWYNAPILYGNPESAEIFPHYSSEIWYKGPTPRDSAEELVDELAEKVEDWFLLYSWYPILLLGIALIGYAIARKISS